MFDSSGAINAIDLLETLAILSYLMCFIIQYFYYTIINYGASNIYIYILIG